MTQLAVLRLFLKSGGAVDVILARDEADSVYERWVRRDYAARGELMLKGNDAYGFRYAVLLEAVGGMFVMPPPQNALSVQVPHQGGYRRDLSGFSAHVCMS